MRGSSADSLAALSDRLVAAVEAGADPTQLGEELFGAVQVLRTQPALRRAATDPTTGLEPRAQMLRAVFGPHLSDAATDIVSTGGGSRWASSTDLVESLERLAVVAIAKAADAAGESDRLEGELFSFGQVIGDHPELREALTDRTRSVADKQALLRGLLEGRAAEGTVRLALQAVASTYPTVRQAFEEYARIATEARGRLVAVVRVAEPLEDTAQSRLADVLTRQYGKPVHLNVVVDESALGGIEVAVGDELIDGTIASRLADAGRRLAG
ncbi:MAG: F0F1 ATP synthase subunit delta [Marmoricola sp.]